MYNDSGGTNEANYCTIRTAINARRVMNIAGFSNGSQYLPWMIWWPFEALQEHATRFGRQVSMLPQIAITCVMSDYEPTYRALNPAPAPTKSLL